MIIWQLLRPLFRFKNIFWFLLVGLALIVISGMKILVQGLTYTLLGGVMLGALLLGRLLAYIRAPWWLALIVMAGTGFQVVFLLVGHLFSKLWAVAQAVAIYVFLLWRQNFIGLPDAGPVQTSAEALAQGSFIVLNRLWVFLVNLGQKSSPDPLPIQLIWGWALWLAMAWAAFLVWQNRQALIAVIPLGVLLTAAMFFTGINSNALLAFLFLALVLQATVSWKRRRQRWETRQMDWATDTAQDVGVAAGVIIAFSVLLSAVIPDISISEIIGRFQFQEELAQSTGRQVDEMAASLGMERRVLPTPAYRPPAIPRGLPRRHLLGSGPELTHKVVMLVKTNEPPPALPEEIEYGNAEPADAHYWMGTTFDRYTGRGWSTSTIKRENLAANEPQLEPQGPGRVFTQTVRLVDPFGNFLFTSGFPLQVDQPSQINLRSNGDWVGTALKTEETYTAQSWLPEPTPAQLQNAGSDYPTWITQRYLQLPETVPDRARALALELTATAPTPYDRAVAIEAHLRTIPYSLEVYTPPRNRDVVDYFLFDLQKGYCDYYASSMVVMARAAGVPARFVIGYAPSPYDYRTDQYVVREAEAHSWVQVYFPEYGWIDFEPTGGRSALDREEEGGNKIAAVPTLPPDFDVDQAVRNQLPWWDTVPLWQLLLMGLSAVGGVSLIVLLTVWGRDLRLARLPADQLVPILEGRLERSARLLGVSTGRGTTPLEFETDLLGRLKDLGQKESGLQKIVPAAGDISQLIQTFIGLRYSPHPVSNEQGKHQFTIWRRVRWRLWGTIIIKKIKRIR